MTVNYTQVINESKNELRALISTREANDRRIAQIIIALRALAHVLPEPNREDLLREIANLPKRPGNLSDAVLNVLTKAEASSGLTTNQIRERLEESGFDLAGYSQPLGTIFTTLKRLIKKGEVKRTDEKDGAIIFKSKVFK